MWANAGSWASCSAICLMLGSCGEVPLSSGIRVGEHSCTVREEPHVQDVLQGLKVESTSAWAASASWDVIAAVARHVARFVAIELQDQEAPGLLSLPCQMG